MRLSAILYRSIPDLIFLALCLLAHFEIFRRTRLHPYRRTVSIALLCSAVWIAFSILFSNNLLVRYLPSRDYQTWIRGIGHLWGLATLGMTMVLLPLLAIERHFSPQRRLFLGAARTVILASPAVITAYGVFAGRKDFGTKEVDIRIPGLHKDLNGLRILQLSDIHMSAFLTEQDLARVIDMANETRPHLCVVTGDLISASGDPLDLCMRYLAKVKSDAGTLGCNGNHEIFSRCQAYVKTHGARLGMNFLRQESTMLRFGNAKLNITGVDHQPFREPYLTGMEQHVDRSAFNILLSHNPDVFPVAAEQGYQLTLAGHTHGGQVTVEILHQYANVARFFTPYVYGHYNKANADLYVTRGIGTVGVPARVGAPPEVTLVRLCAS